MSRRKGLGRGLSEYEVALIKNMRRQGRSRDFIMSMILRPGRVLSPAAVDEVSKGKIGPDIPPATDPETETFVQRRLASSRPLDDRDLGGPTAQTVVLEVLRAARGNALFSAIESKTLEYKQALPELKTHRVNVARTMAAFANASGGHIVFGVRDDGCPLGLGDGAPFAKACDQILDIVTESFCPAIEWDKNLIEYEGLILGVIYVYESRLKPVICMKDGDGLIKSTIYYRYEGKSQRIEPGDLIRMLHAGTKPILEPLSSSVETEQR